MRWIASLTSELTQLITESKRKHPELKAAAEQALNEVKSFVEEGVAISKIRQSPMFLIPFLLGCNIQSAKCCAIAIGSLQKLIGVSAIPSLSIPSVLEAFREAILLGVEIQLKILQVLPMFLTNYTVDLSGNLLAETFNICFVLQNNKSTVVQNTASATLRQLVILVFDRTINEVEEKHEKKELENSQALIDAHNLMEDLCLLINDDKSRMLHIQNLSKTFGLELIESILTNHPKVFQKHDKQIKLLRNLMFLVLRPFSNKGGFPVTVRSARIIYLLLRQHLKNLIVESEIAFNLFCRILIDKDDNNWRRVLVMEIFRGICTDNALICTIYEYYDADASRKNILYEIIFSFNKLAGEQPGLIGLGTNILFNNQLSNDDSYDSMYEILENAIDIFGTITGEIIEQCPPGLDSKTSSVRVSCIDQLDKLEGPILPPTYIYYLVFTCLNLVVDGIAKIIIPFFKRGLPRKLGNLKEKSEPVSNNLPESFLGNQEVFTCSKIIENMWPAFLAVSNFLRKKKGLQFKAFSTFLSASMSIDLFHNLIRSYRHFTQVSGYMGYNISRNSFLTTISKFSLPPVFMIPFNALHSNVTNDVQNTHQLNTNNSASDITSVTNLPLHDSDNVMILTQKNLICLQAMLLLSIHLGNNLGNSWAIILETLRKVELIIYEMAKKNHVKFPHSILGIDIIYNTIQKEVLTLPKKNNLIVDISSIVLFANTVFENTKTFSDSSLLEILKTICELNRFSEIFENKVSSEMKGIDIKKNVSTTAFYNYQGAAIFHKSNDLAFTFHKINLICKINIERLFFGASEENGWDIVMSYLYSFIHSRKVDSLIRKQATKVFLNITEAVIISQSWKNLENSDKALRKILSIINFLSMKNIMGDINVQLYPNDRAVELEIISMALNVLNLLLNSLGHLISESWDIVFEIINSIFENELSSFASFKQDHSDILHYRKKELRSSLKIPKIVKDAFFSLQLICTDFLLELSSKHFLTLINILTKFCLQKDDLNISLTAIGLFWNISDNLRLKKSFQESIKTFDSDNELNLLCSLEDDISVQDLLWIILLFRLIEVILDDRSEVRNGAIQTIFRNFEIHGENIKSNLWKCCFRIIIYRIFFLFNKDILKNINDNKCHEFLNNTDNSSFEDSLVLIISGLVALFSRNLDSLFSLEIFHEIWDKLLDFFTHSIELNSNDVFMNCCKAIDNILYKMEYDKLGSNYDDLYKKIWSVWEIFSNTVSTTSDNLFKNQELSQEALDTFVKFSRSLYKFIVSKGDISLINKLITSIFDALIYTRSPVYYLDVDYMTPLQSSILEVIDLLKDHNEQTCVLSLKFLAKISTLAFKDLPESITTNQNSSKTNKIFSTYIAISKISFERMEQYFSKYSENTLIYEENAFFEMIKALSIPIKLKHKCPLTSRIGNGELFWKFATSKMLSILEKCDSQKIIPDSNMELWEAITDCLHGTLLFDYSSNNSIFFKESDEDFDISTYTKLKSIIFPLITDSIEISQNIAEIIVKSSFVYNCPEQSLIFDRLSSITKIPNLEIKNYKFQKIVPYRERLGFICLNDLFELCSLKSKNEFSNKKSLAMIIGTYLLKRCAMVLQQFILNQSMRGCMPISRIEHTEIIFILDNLINREFYSDMFDFPDISYDNIDKFYCSDSLVVQLFPLFCAVLPHCHQDVELLKLISLYFQKVGNFIHIYEASVKY
ncbi:hypothetical protein T552_03391 [Pneumocystis carinii B80]|uniref:Protein MON2 homolog n=1 Tax=Pneumocystis carinii (strain B80) TaxID=1408658 RepID=A0A0W4ZBI8_PNEC8|nr:hypothetical protein T552_03391 [Pneumocystis carinii B80]KTW25778.1 hypothetical protein T552_03391 [Pneumocystis carinii B80]